MNEQEQFWSGADGDAYTKRNSKVDWRARIPFWHDIMKFTGARSVYEVGCGAGWNLSAIREASPHEVALSGSEINKQAALQARAAGFEDRIYNGRAEDGIPCESVELAFSAGVLIHIAPENLEHLMRLIVGTSSRYVLAIEYASDAEEMVEYRGVKDRLWKRNYGKLYQDMGLRLEYQSTEHPAGFDRCTAWLFSK